MNVNDFDFIRVIGRGSYAKVIYVSIITYYHFSVRTDLLEITPYNNCIHFLR